MADAYGATCPRCGAPLPANALAGLCPCCILSDAQGAESAAPRVDRPSPRRPRRKLPLASVASAMGAILLAGVWFGSGCHQQPAGAVDYYNRGDALYHEGKQEQAIAAFREAIRIRPNYVAAHAILGAALKDQGKLEEAIAEFREAIRIQPDFAVACYVLGDALLEQGKLEEGIAALRDAIRLQPNNALAHNGLGVALSKQGKLEEAITAYREAIRIQPDDADAHNNLGAALRDQGKLEEAIAEFRQAIGIEPEDALAHNNLAWSLVLSANRPRRDYDEALIHARRAVERAPRDGTFFNTLALTEYRLGHGNESLAASEQSLALKNGGHAVDWFILALAYWQKGDRDQARSRFDQAIAWTKQNAPKSTSLRQLWTEAAELLGQPGPAAPGAGSPAAAAAEKPRSTEP